MILVSGLISPRYLSTPKQVTLVHLLSVTILHAQGQSHLWRWKVFRTKGPFGQGLQYLLQHVIFILYMQWIAALSVALTKVLINCKESKSLWDTQILQICITHMLTYLFPVTFFLPSLLLLLASCSTSWHILVPSTRRWCHLTVIIEISPAGMQPYSYIQNTKNVWIKNTTLLFYVITKHIISFPLVFFFS